MKRPKIPEPTAQELAVVERQSRQLDEEMEESEKRLKAIARGKLGTRSLLAKAGSAKSATRGASAMSGTGYSGSSGAGSSGARSGNSMIGSLTKLR
jgi:hypothetical protein